MARSKGQGSITLRKDGLYMGRITKNGITKTFYNKDKKIVEFKLLEYSKLSEFKKVCSIKFSDYVRDYLYTFKYKHIKDSSFDRLDSIYRNHIENSSIGCIPLSQLNDVVIQQYINAKVSTGCSLSSTKKIFEMIRGVLFYAYKKNDITVDYSALLKMPSESCFKDVKHIETYTKEECKILTDYIMNRYACSKKEMRFLRYSPAFIIMLNTGLRAGEVLALTWDDVGSENLSISKSVSLVRVRDSSAVTKYQSIISSVKTSASKRIVPLNDVAIDCLNELKSRYSDFDCACKYVVCNLNDDFIKLRSFESKFEQICQCVGIKYKGVHALRHTFASNLIEKGVSPKVVSELLGHTNVVFTLNRYVHPNDEQKISAVNLLNV